MAAYKKIVFSKEKSFHGNLSLWPEYKLYLIKTFAIDEEDFLKKIKSLRQVLIIRLMDFYLNCPEI